MFIAIRRDGMIFRTLKKDAFGDRVYEKQGVAFGWSPIYMRDNLSDSSVRADSSASRGRAEERVSDVRIAMEPRSNPKKGDKITLTDGQVMSIIRVQERMMIGGKINHWEVDCGSA